MEIQQLKGFFYSAVGFQLEQYLYWVVLVIIIAIWLLPGRKDPEALFSTGVSESWRRWIIILVFVLVCIGILTFISINSHSGLHGYHERF